MKHGNISCSCGYNFYFETEMASVYCLNCNAKHDIQQTEEVTSEYTQDKTLYDELGFDPAALV